MDRRNWLRRACVALGAAASGLFALPLVALRPLKWRRDEIFAPVGLLAKLNEGEATRRVVVAQWIRDAWTVQPAQQVGSVWVVRSGDSVRCWSSVCPHAGCAVEKEGAGFACPCHNSVFDAEGRVVSGPSARPMDELDTEVREGEVFVRFQRFRSGAKSKVPA